MTERIKIHADVERADRLIANLTAHQLAILGVAGLLVWGLYGTAGPLLPLPVFGAIAVPIIGVAAALALVQRDGVALDQLLLAAWRQSRRPRRMVYLPEGAPETPAWAPPADPAPAPLWLPVQAVRRDGTIDLGTDGVAAIVSCSTVSFALRTNEEQQALTAAFGRWLNSLTGPVQIVISAESVNLAPSIERLRRDASALPHPALEKAALDHAAFLAHLDASRDLLRRRVLLVLREPYDKDTHGAAGRVLRRAEDACRALSAASVEARVLTANEATAALASAIDPGCPPGMTGQAATDEIITARGGSPR